MVPTHPAPTAPLLPRSPLDQYDPDPVNASIKIAGLIGQTVRVYRGELPNRDGETCACGCEYPPEADVTFIPHGERHKVDMPTALHRDCLRMNFAQANRDGSAAVLTIPHPAAPYSWQR